MGHWDIDPVGVQSVVDKTATKAEGFKTHGEKYGKAMQSGAGACGSQIVALALQDFAEHNKHELSSMVKRTVRSLTGAVNATKAYVHGDLEMAARAQKAATQTARGHHR